MKKIILSVLATLSFTAQSQETPNDNWDPRLCSFVTIGKDSQGNKLAVDPIPTAVFQCSSPENANYEVDARIRFFRYAKYPRQGFMTIGYNLDTGEAATGNFFFAGGSACENMTVNNLFTSEKYQGMSEYILGRSPSGRSLILPSDERAEDFSGPRPFTKTSFDGFMRNNIKENWDAYSEGLPRIWWQDFPIHCVQIQPAQ